MDDFPAGSVWLVGAGPGDPELLTRKAERLIGAASVIFHDALVGEGVLALARPGVRLVHVGKRAGRHSKDQGTIDALIVAAALAGERVVRLKGGDPSIFGRSTEELVSVDFKGNPHSSIVDAAYTKVMDGDFVKVLSWYDNEWGYSSRCVDLLRLLVKKGL